MSLEPAEGQLVGGRFLLMEHIGTGGMGTVWKAQHTVTRRKVALKLMLAPLQASEQGRRRFLVEARAAASVDHPNVVYVDDVFEDEDGTLVMVMDLLDGESLRALLEREGALPAERAADVFSCIVSAVGTAHAVGVLHRDLKPENVFLVTDAEPPHCVRVLDFGLAKLVGDEDDEPRDGSLTATGARLGTPHYMAPEQAAGERAIDHRADVWTLGVMLYEALSGVRPIEGAGVADVYEKVLTEAITPLRALTPTLPEDLLTLVDRMLMRDPKARPKDLREVLDVLSRHATCTVPSFGAPGSAPLEVAPPSSDRVVVVTPGANAEAGTQPLAVRPGRADVLLSLAVLTGLLAIGVLFWRSAPAEPDVAPERRSAAASAPPVASARPEALPTGSATPPPSALGETTAPSTRLSAPSASTSPPRAPRPKRSARVVRPAASTQAPREPAPSIPEGFVETPPF